MTVTGSLERMQTAAVLVIGRTLHKVWFDRNGKFRRGEYGGVDTPRRIAVENVDQANLVSSKTERNTHAPAIDIDFPIHIVPSSTPGHYHLYIEKEMSWQDYKKLLTVMHDVGIIEDGFFQLSMKFEQTFLRLPHIRKGTPDGGVKTSSYDDDYR